jgi:uncharacterized coiled-coil protein SlyX
MDNWVHDLGDNASSNAKAVAQETYPKMHLDEAMDKRLRDLEDKASSNAKAIAQIRKDQAEFGTQRIRLQGLLVRMTNCEARMDDKQRVDKSNTAATIHDIGGAATNERRAEGHGSINDDIARIDSDIEKICADNHDLWADRQAFHIRLVDIEQRLAKLESASSSAHAHQKSTNTELISILASPPRKETNAMMPAPSSTLRDSLRAPHPGPLSSSARAQQNGTTTELGSVFASPSLKELKTIMPMLSSTLRDSLHAGPSAQEFVPGQPWHNSGESVRKVRAVKW